MNTNTHKLTTNTSATTPQGLDTGPSNSKPSNTSTTQGTTGNTSTTTPTLITHEGNRRVAVHTRQKPKQASDVASQFSSSSTLGTHMFSMNTTPSSYNDKASQAFQQLSLNRSSSMTTPLNQGNRSTEKDPNVVPNPFNNLYSIPKNTDPLNMQPVTLENESSKKWSLHGSTHQQKHPNLNLFNSSFSLPTNQFNSSIETGTNNISNYRVNRTSKSSTHNVPMTGSRNEHLNAQKFGDIRSNLPNTFSTLLGDQFNTGTEMYAGEKRKQTADVPFQSSSSSISSTQMPPPAKRTQQFKHVSTHTEPQTRKTIESANKFLLMAVAANNIAFLETAIEQGADVNVRDASGSTPLHIASREGYVKIAAVLLSKGADVHAKDAHNLTPPHLAIDNDHNDLASLLMSDKTNMHVTDETRINSHEMVSTKSYAPITELVSKSSDAYTRLQDAYTFVQNLAASEGVELIGERLTRNGNKCVKTRNGQIFWDLVSIYNDIPTMERLFSGGLDVNVQDKDGWTCLHWAVSWRQLESIEFLLSKGAKLDIQSNLGTSPWELAFTVHYPEIIEFFLNKDLLTIDNKTKHNETLLHRVIEEKHIPLIELLIDKGANLNEQDTYKNTPLHTAIQKSYIQIAELLINKGADVHAKDRYENTPLHLAVEKGFDLIIDRLKNKGADINAKNKYGMTPFEILQSRHSLRSRQS